MTNRDFLVNTLRSAEFLAGDTTTDFIDRVEPARGLETSDEERARSGAPPTPGLVVGTPRERLPALGGVREQQARQPTEEQEKPKSPRL